MSLVSSNDKPAAASARQRIGVRFVPTLPVNVPILQVAKNQTGLPEGAPLAAKAKRVTFLALSGPADRRAAGIATEWKGSPPEAAPAENSTRQPSWPAKGRS